MTRTRFTILAAAAGLMVLALTVLATANDPVHAGGATYTVDTTSDASLTGCTGVDNDCSLRGAISRANAALSPQDSITFDAADFPATITISSALTVLSGGGDTIDATGRGVIIDAVNVEPAAAAFSCLRVLSANNTVSGLQLTDCQIGINVESTAADDNTIGPGNTLYDNLSGIFLTGDSNDVRGNMLGTTPDGMSVHPDGGNDTGITLIGDSNVIGGTAAADRNIISGSLSQGIDIQPSADATLIIGNYIGTDVTGAVDLGNATNGVIVAGTGAIIGGDTAGERNVISGNNFNGVRIANGATAGNAVLGNYIGTTADGMGDLGNSIAGVQIQGGSGNCIGGALIAAVCTTAAGTRNVISGNNSVGVGIGGATSANNVVFGNYIGLAADGVGSLGNTSHGIRIDDATNSRIGDLTPGNGNRIAHNGGDGIFIASGTANEVLSNEIFSNTGLGIDLGTNGVTPNDTDDPDMGANDLQNFPVLTGMWTSGAGITIYGFMNSTPNTDFFNQFFHSASCDPSGNGEGETLIGSGGGVPTNAGGDLTFSLTFPVTVPIGHFVTAVGDPDGPPHNSSEFSACLQLTGDADADGVNDDDDVCILWPNPAQNFPPWPVPAGDFDCDGFTDAAENTLATDAADACPDNASDDAWPPDINMTGAVSVTDVLFLKPFFGQSVPPAPARFDLVPTSPPTAINITDVVEFKKYFGLSCT